jgi:hypothetical protein
MARSENEKRTRMPAKRNTGGSPAERQNKTTPVSNNTPATNAPGRMMPALRMDERNFDMVVDGVPYSVRSVPFLFNDEPRFRVCINGGTEHLFTWDSQAGMLRAIDDESSTIPSVVEEALSERLQSK